MIANAVSLTVLVIAHDDEKTLFETIERVYHALAITVEDFSIVIYDDGSSDGTLNVAKAAKQKFAFVEIRHNESEAGRGHCIIEVSNQAKTTYLVYVPGDNTWLLRSLIDLFGHLGKADVITSYSNNLLFAMPPFRRLVSRTYTILLNAIFRKGMRYYNGLTIYPVDYLKQLTASSRGFGFQAEALLKAVIAGHSYLEIALPVDSESLLAARSVTLANTIDAWLTIVRLMFALQFSRVFGNTEDHGRPRAIGSHSARVVEDAGSEPGRRSSLRVVICGASSGIGARLAEEMDRDGHRVFVCARRADRLERLREKHASITAFACDVSKESDVAAFAAALTKYIDSVDVLINCAGEFGEIGPLAESDSERWWSTIESNLKGTYLIARHFLPLLRRGTRARIINFSGGGAFSPAPNYSAYACSKSAIVRLTECLAAEVVSSNIRVNAIAPGFMPTEMHQATLAAGEERAGRLQYQRTRAILQQGGDPLALVVDCVRMMISAALDNLTGKTISVNFDPWQTRTFADQLADVVRSDLYTMRRVNIVNLPHGRLRSTLSQPWVERPPEW